jgi:flagellar motor switch/type III secretory pathway protein FliN
MGEAAAVAAKKETDTKAGAKWEFVMALPCDLTVELPMPGFKVADLVQLSPQTVIDSHWHAGEDVPLRVNGQLVAWGEFEVVSDRLAVRITELH